MSEANAFFDTNVLLYLLSNDAAKADRAEALLAAGGVISVQVLNEFAAIASRKLGLAWSEIREMLGTVQSLCQVEPMTVATHARGLAIAERYGFSIDDSLIVAAALLAGCEVVWTEDHARWTAHRGPIDREEPLPHVLNRLGSIQRRPRVPGGPIFEVSAERGTITLWRGVGSPCPAEERAGSRSRSGAQARG